MLRPTLLTCTVLLLGLAATPAPAEVATELLSNAPGKWKAEAPTAAAAAAAEICLMPTAPAVSPPVSTPTATGADAASALLAGKDRSRQSLQQALRSGH